MFISDENIFLFIMCFAGFVAPLAVYLVFVVLADSKKQKSISQLKLVE